MLLRDVFNIDDMWWSIWLPTDYRINLPNYQWNFRTLKSRYCTLLYGIKPEFGSVSPYVVLHSPCQGPYMTSTSNKRLPWPLKNIETNYIPITIWLGVYSPPFTSYIWPTRWLQAWWRASSPAWTSWSVEPCSTAFGSARMIWRCWERRWRGPSELEIQLDWLISY